MEEDKMLDEVVDNPNVGEEQNPEINPFDTLYEQVAGRCYVSSDDSLIKERLSNIIKNAVYNVKSLLAITDENFDFSISSMENELFINYCFYRWNNRSQKEFENNYIGDIISIRTKNEVAYKKSLESPTEDNTEESTTDGNTNEGQLQ